MTRYPQEELIIHDPFKAVPTHQLPSVSKFPFQSPSNNTNTTQTKQVNTVTITTGVQDNFQHQFATPRTISVNNQIPYSLPNVVTLVDNIPLPRQMSYQSNNYDVNIYSQQTYDFNSGSSTNNFFSQPIEIPYNPRIFDPIPQKTHFLNPIPQKTHFLNSILDMSDQVFRKYDSNGSGFLDGREIHPAICELFGSVGRPKPSYSQVIAILNSFDQDRNGLIDLTEFRRIVTDLYAL